MWQRKTMCLLSGPLFDLARQKTCPRAWADIYVGVGRQWPAGKPRRPTSTRSREPSQRRRARFFSRHRLAPSVSRQGLTFAKKSTARHGGHFCFCCPWTMVPASNGIRHGVFSDRNRLRERSEYPQRRPQGQQPSLESRHSPHGLSFRHPCWGFGIVGARA